MAEVAGQMIPVVVTTAPLLTVAAATVGTPMGAAFQAMLFSIGANPSDIVVDMPSDDVLKAEPAADDLPVGAPIILMGQMVTRPLAPIMPVQGAAAKTVASAPIAQSPTIQPHRPKDVVADIPNTNLGGISIEAPWPAAQVQGQSPDLQTFSTTQPETLTPILPMVSAETNGHSDSASPRLSHDAARQKADDTAQEASTQMRPGAVPTRADQPGPETHRVGGAATSRRTVVPQPQIMLGQAPALPDDKAVPKPPAPRPIPTATLRQPMVSAVLRDMADASSLVAISQTLAPLDAQVIPKNDVILPVSVSITRSSKDAAPTPDALPAFAIGPDIKQPDGSVLLSPASPVVITASLATLQSSRPGSVESAFTARLTTPSPMIPPRSAEPDLAATPLPADKAPDDLAPIAVPDAAAPARPDLSLQAQPPAMPTPLAHPNHAAPRAFTSADPVSLPNLPQALVNIAKQPETGIVELRLDPVELGGIHVTMRGHDTDLAITVVVDRPETRDLLRKHVDQFVADLRQSGITGPAISFDLAGQQGSAQRPPVPLHDPLPDGALSLAPPIPHPPVRVARAGGLDLRL
jgi:hypothetical protein